MFRRAVLLPAGLAALALAAAPAAAPADRAPAGETPRADCGLEAPEIALRAPAVPRRATELAPTAGQRHHGPLVTPVRSAAPAAPTAPTAPTASAAPTAPADGAPRAFGGGGALLGKTVYLSAGHGWTWAANAWRTQRGNTNDIVEDLVSAEVIDQYLAEYLERMGARVVTVRERDLTPARVIVDDADAVLEGAVVEGPAGPAGWGALPEPFTAAENPFTAGGTRTLQVATTERGRAVYAPPLPASGEYGVYVAWAAGADRAPDAHVIVRHAGGEAHFRVDQRRHGGTWVWLGRWRFEAGAPPERASVAIADDSFTAGAVVSLDAVRFGGGLGIIDRGGGVNGRPQWEHNARYQAQLMGAPDTVYDYSDTDGNDDVGTRSRFAAWDHEAGEDAVFLAWHTNAPNPARGTESYTYGPSPPPGPIGEFSGTPGSLELQAAVHDELIADLRAAWDPAWIDRGKRTAYFGEVNPTHNPETPAVLVEIGFHDTPADADALRDPRFRRLAARALAQGVARYFTAKDGVTLILPPEPPSAVRVVNDGAGGLVVAWRPPLPEPGAGDDATGYRVYVSRDGVAFDDGRAADGESLVLDGLTPGDVRFVRVTSLNIGGESLPSEAVGARVGPAPLLVVGAFDRLESRQLVRENLSAFGLMTVDRMLLTRMNDGSHAGRHGMAIAAAGVSFDGASDEAVEQGDVDVRAYDVIDWFAGEESASGAPVGPAARAELAVFLAAGGRLLLSGSEVAWAMDFMGSLEEQAFLEDLLGVSYAADDAATYVVTPAAGPYQGLASFSFDDTGEGSYDADFPDVLTPGPGAALALGYADGPSAGGAAGVVFGAGAPGARAVVLGFPFETVAGADARAALMAATLAFFEVEPDPLPPDAGPGGGNDDLGGGCSCRAAGRAAGGSGGVGGGGAAALLALLISLGVVGMLRRPS